MRQVLRWIARACAVLGVAYAGSAASLYLLQDAVLFRPTRTVRATPMSDASVPFAPVSLSTADGVHLRAWSLTPANGAHRGTVLFFHGNGGNLGSVVHPLELLRGVGFDVLAPDYRGYGESDGTPNEDGLYRDADATWSWAMTHGAVPEKTVIWGYSLGGGVASWLATQHAAGALVLQSTYTSIPDEAASLYPFFPCRWLVRAQFPTRDRLASIHMPVAVIHGATDRRIPESLGRENYAAAHEPKTFVEFGGGHEVDFHHTPEAWKKVDEFLAGNGFPP